MDDLYCEQCGCAIYSPSDIGAAWVETIVHTAMALRLRNFRREWYTRRYADTTEHHIICISCIEEAERDTLNSLTIADKD